MTEDKIQELLKPRYKVIADYPGTHFTVGEILCLEWDQRQKQYRWKGCDAEGVVSESETFFSDYPHLFRKLEWWEGIEKKDLPAYIKFIVSLPEKISIRKAWDFEIFKDGRCIVKTNCYINKIVIRQELSPYDMPATEQDFIDYQKQKS